MTHPVAPPVAVYAQTDHEHARCHSDGPGVWSSGDVSVRLIQAEQGLSVQLNAPDTRLRRVAFRWEAEFKPGVRVYQDHWERGYGDLGWYPASGDRVLPWYFLARDTSRTCGFGVQTGAGAMAYWRLEPRSLILVLDVRSGGSGMRLGDRDLTAATVVMDEAASDVDPFTFATDFCRRLCPAPRLPKLPVYGGNDWYYAYSNNSFDQIARDADNVSGWAAGLENRPFMVIDDGWQQTRLRSGINGGPWLPNARFGDMAKMAARIRESGAKPGIWLRPLLTVERVPEDWLLGADRFKNPYAALGQLLDPTVPEALDLIGRDIRRLTQEWGYELVKHDWTTWDLLGRWGFEMSGQITDDGWRFSDDSLTTAEVIGRLYHRIRQEAGAAILIGCNTVGHLAAGTHELQRTGDDTSGREWERTRRMGINTLAMRMPQHSTFFACDADCVGLTASVPWHLNRQWLQVLAHSGTPLFVSADPAAVGVEQRAALVDAFSAASRPLPPAKPLDWMTSSTPRLWQTHAADQSEFEWWDETDLFAASRGP